MFLAQHPGRKGCGIIGFVDRHGGLRDDRSMVEFRGHEMHTATVQLDACCKRLGMRIEAGKRR